jgi:Na+-driven multidrug efflux pump
MVQRYSVLSIPVSMVLALVLRFISSVKQNDLLLRAAALAVVLNLAVDLVLGKWIGVKGIALSTAIVQSATVLYLIARLRAPLTFGTANIRTAGTPDSRRPEASLESESREGR